MQTAKTLRTVKVKTAQVMQEKKQKICMFLNENRRQAKLGKVVADVTSVGRLFHKRLPATGKAHISYF